MVVVRNNLHFMLQFLKNLFLKSAETFLHLTITVTVLSVFIIAHLSNGYFTSNFTFTFFFFSLGKVEVLLICSLV